MITSPYINVPHVDWCNNDMFHRTTGLILADRNIKHDTIWTVFVVFVIFVHLLSYTIKIGRITL